MALSVLNHLKKQTNTQINELVQEMKIESSKTLEHYAYSGENKIGEFTKNYSDYAGEEYDIYFIVGNQNSQEAYHYPNGTKTLLSPSFASNTLNATIDGILYSFNFNKGENFYFVIIQKLNGEKYILRG
jgi:hypothetical protein